VNSPSGVRGGTPTAKGFSLYPALMMASPDTMILLIVDYYADIGGETPSPPLRMPLRHHQKSNPRCSAKNPYSDHSLHCALSLAAQSIVIGPVCVFATGVRRAFRLCVCVCVFVCAFVGLYHDKSKLRLFIFTKLGL